ncbi:MAG: alkaline ceramidase [Candidatus Hydrogenedentes bacterium]|nr:alkaline ceramidase [Candidatus Hydrogenedentota bacterium]
MRGITGALVLLALAAACSLPVMANALHAGAASAIVSPPPGAFIAGDARNRRFAGVHDDLFARAAVISDGARDLALVVIDCIGMLHPDIEQIRVRAAAHAGRAGLTPERIVVSSTHTHCGPDVVGIWGPDEVTSGRDALYMERLIDAAADQIVLAAQRLRPVTARWAAAEGDHEWVENICEPELLDRTLSIMQFVGEDGATVATLTNFACHPTVMDGVTDQVSSDYVVGFYRAMSEALGGEHLFLQGAIGGWVQPVKEGRGFALADQYGASVAASALDALKSAESADAATIEFASRKLELPLENEGFKALESIGVLTRGSTETIRTEVAWFRIGPVQFATHPGETSPMYSLQTRELMGEGPHFILGLTLDALGYILKPDYFTDAGRKYAEYLTSMSVGPETGPRMMDALKAIIPPAPKP